MIKPFSVVQNRNQYWYINSQKTGPITNNKLFGTDGQLFKNIGMPIKWLPCHNIPCQCIFKYPLISYWQLISIQTLLDTLTNKYWLPKHPCLNITDHLGNLKSRDSFHRIVPPLYLSSKHFIMNQEEHVSF